MSFIGNLWKRVVNFLNGVSENSVTKAEQLKSNAKGMMESVNLLADATSYSMALADEKRKELAEEVEKFEALKAQAEDFLSTGDEEGAKRCVFLQIQAEAKISRLQEEYRQLQSEAENNVEQLYAKKRDVDARVAEIPNLQETARANEIRKKIEDNFSPFKLESAASSFDEAAREIRVKSLQLQNKAMLGSDPNARIDRQIQDAALRKRVSDEMENLRARVAEGKTVVSEEKKKQLDTSVSSAKNLLEAPRYKGVLPLLTSERSKVPVGTKKISE